jgi:uncharacterized protein YkwD
MRNSPVSDSPYQENSDNNLARSIRKIFLVDASGNHRTDLAMSKENSAQRLLPAMFLNHRSEIADRSARKEKDFSKDKEKSEKPTNDKTIMEAIEVEVNRRRVENGLKPLEHNDDQEKLALKNSNKMTAKNRIGHFLRESGFENAAMLPWDKEKSPTEIAKEIVDMWMDSAGHRANLLRRKVTCMGVGVEGKFQTLRLA